VCAKNKQQVCCPLPPVKEKRKRKKKKKKRKKSWLKTKEKRKVSFLVRGFFGVQFCDITYISGPSSIRIFRQIWL
jgi:hypothetical protein